MENRRADDGWREHIEDRIDNMNENLAKNNMLLTEILDAWDAVKGGMRALEWLAKGLKIIAAIGVGVIAVYHFSSKLFGKG
jgi:hypothetical protein